jgi:hypothetical protein
MIIEIEVWVALWFSWELWGGKNLAAQTRRGNSLIPVLAAAGLLVAGVVLGDAMGRFILHAQPPHPPAAAVPVHFTDVRQAAGITFQHDATMSDEKEYIETMGNGVGWTSASPITGPNSGG